MRKFLLTLAFCLSASLAQAQFNLPDDSLRGVGSGPACNTSGAFLVRGGNGPQCSTTALSTAALNGAATINGTATLNGGPLTINTPTGSSTQGFNITQIGPSTGSQAGFLAYNEITISDGANVTGDSRTWGILLQYVLNSTNSQGNKIGFGIQYTVNAAQSGAGDRIAFAPVNIIQSTLTGGGVYGANPGAVALSGATGLGEIAALECDTRMDSGASASYRFGCASVSTGTVQGSTLDAAYEIGAIVSGPWKTGIILDNIHGGAPIGTTGCVICTDGSANTITTGFDLSSYTISGNFLKGPGSFQVTGAGALTATSGALSGLTGLAIRDT